MKTKKIEKNINNFLNRGDISHRFSSYDFCYNYFQKFKNTPKKLYSNENIEMSCLHLMNFLASWGMLRGSSDLLWKSLGFYKGIIKIISKYPDLWKVDLDNYNEKNIERMKEFYNDVKDYFKKENKDTKVSVTLITKILMGVYGCVPAVDDLFSKGVKKKSYKLGSKKNFENILWNIKDIYSEHKEVIDKKSKEVTTISFHTEKHTNIHYKKSKILDMIFWWEGYKLDKNKKKRK